MLNLIYNNTATTAASFNKTQTLTMDVFSENKEGRAEVESFIRHGYQKSYKANISIAMPFLLSVSEGKLKAALGIRSASSPLFIEQYLDVPINELDLFKSQHIQRNDIVEIGSLYSNSKRFTVPLFLVTAIALFCLGFKYMVFSGTEIVIGIISKAGINCQYICDADAELLNESGDEWGSYYETSPKVVALSLAEVARVIDSQPYYQKLFQGLDKDIANVSKSLGAS
ncbi:thermostable hemolysin [Cognaticolwellia mytili]|uniref:thermostable hemolysin n=1 Tax=Cognaticolwellia mytili TaxID=1888913 RepID=UPI000A170735|nr:thermostable hemolysin [Cognaticolwellia mytili]